MINEKIDLVDVTTWGLEVDFRYGGYKLPVILKKYPDIVDRLSIIAEKNNAKSPFYGSLDTIYFRVPNITKKQRENILNKGRQRVNIEFVLLDVKENRKGDRYLDFKLTGLGVVEVEEEESPRDI